MKSLIKTALVIGLIAFGCADSFGTYSRTTTNGGPNGYSSTYENIDDDGNVTIRCSDPGSEGCPTSVAGQKSIYTSLTAYALQEIAGGTLSGSHSAGSGGITYTVTWTATDLKNASVSITP
jgi:hypothetical protein